MKKFRLPLFRLLCPLLMVWIGTASAQTVGTIHPTDLTCEYLKNPEVIDVAQPRLSWINTADDNIRGASQSAWQIQVASSQEALLDGKADLWDSKKTKGDQSILVQYEGEPLQSRQICWWRVRVWDNNGKASEWSAPAYWGMGILNPSEWKGQWIGAPWQGDQSLEDMGEQTPPPAPLLRKAFSVDKPIASARFYGTGLGYFELYLNGEKVSEDVLVPNQTNYGKRPGLEKKGIAVEDNFREYRVMYLGYDVTDMIRQGDNVVGAILGNGFFNPVIHWTKAYGSPRFIGQIHITYTDGTEEVIASDASWKASKSAIVSDMIYAGEHYDARLEQPGWVTPGFDDSSWEAVAIRRFRDGSICTISRERPDNGSTSNTSANRPSDRTATR